MRQRSIDLPPPLCTVPEGYQIRSLRGPEEIEARVAVHQDAFAPSRMTIARHTTAMRMPTYRMDLDLVVEAPDGSFAAFCIVWFDAANRMGVFEPVGCHSAHRRRRLASAVMLEGLRRLQALGAHTAHVVSLAGAEAAEQLYESLGFTVLDRDDRWERMVD